MKKIFILSFALIIFSSLLINKDVFAYGECDQYGSMAMYDGFGSCKCMSGYIFGKNFLGESYCVSGSSFCSDKYGYGSKYDSFSGSCECSYGYVFGKDSIGRTQCITKNKSCQNQYGYNSSSTYGDKCECNYGYAFDDNNKCEDGDTICSRKHGMYSSYNDSGNKCECDEGYTFDDSSQCVKKQNNVYFTLKELDTDSRKALIKSDYDYSYYSITYNSGCYASSFKRYLNHQIVVNLGTDFSLDTWDKIVLQDDDETCDITHKEKVDSTFSLEEDTSGVLTLEQLIAINKLNEKNTTPAITPTVIKSPGKPEPIINKIDKQIKKEENKTSEIVKTGQKEEFSPTVNPKPIKKITWYQKIFNWFKGK